MRDVRLNEARMGRSGGVASSRRTSRRRIQSPGRNKHSKQLHDERAAKTPEQIRRPQLQPIAGREELFSRREELFSRRERKDRASCAIKRERALLRSGACHQVIVRLFGTCNKIAVRVPVLGQPFVTIPGHSWSRAAGASDGERAVRYSLQDLLM